MKPYVIVEGERIDSIVEKVPGGYSSRERAEKAIIQARRQAEARRTQRHDARKRRQHDTVLVPTLYNR